MKLTCVTGRHEKDERHLSADAASPDRLLFDNYEFLRRCCARVAGLPPATFENNCRNSIDVAKELSAEELLNDVVEKLRRDDFKVLREFTGRASITTYLTTIVVNLARDRHRSVAGRVRPGKQIKEYDELGRLVQQLVIEKNFTPEAAHQWLVHEKKLPCSLEQVCEIITALKKQQQKNAASDPDMPKVIAHADTDDEYGETSYTIVDGRPLQDRQLISTDKERLRDRVLQQFINGLSGEERMMLRFRFPADEEEEPKGFAEIGRLMGITEKAVDHRIRRILVSFREKLLAQGIGLDDLLDCG